MFRLFYGLDWENNNNCLYAQSSTTASPPPPIVNPPPLTGGDPDYEEEIDSEEDYQDNDDDDEDLDARPASTLGRGSTVAPNRGRPGTSTNTGRGNVANNLLDDEDDEDADSILNLNGRDETNGRLSRIFNPFI